MAVIKREGLRGRADGAVVGWKHMLRLRYSRDYTQGDSRTCVDWVVWRGYT